MTKTTNASAIDDEEKRRMEFNRIRAREIRKRKKKMEEEMRQKIIQLTLENNRLLIKKKMQQDEIDHLTRIQKTNMKMICAVNQQKQQAALLNQNLLSPTSNELALILQQQQQQQQQQLILQQQNALQASLGLDPPKGSSFPLLPSTETLLSNSPPIAAGMAESLASMRNNNVHPPGFLGGVPMGYSNNPAPLSLFDQKHQGGDGGSSSISNRINEHILHQATHNQRMLSPHQLSSFSQLPTTPHSTSRSNSMTEHEKDAMNNINSDDDVETGGAEQPITTL
eukprot:CAMPEP_0203674814 /NCGR_PEP_ID=MMETSP0090-20130426/17498_1 /ASSEMBLY_ACC=CAM_ASM_001088 /TAXON_ID=426623 /ORGANISM="Chaetoceros affinis, Strain CCMP159" /LENGTH=281 /DNA_ID=CAMNT_0050540789 /DNA_START=95 /DNA_END=940 /DNA_ORIENTATION=+